MRIEIEFDVSAYERDADVFVERAIGPACVDAVNAAAVAARRAVVEAMPAYLDRPTPFTLLGVGAFPATAYAGSEKESAALVRIGPQQAEYMRYMILGGDRGPGDYAATAQGPIVPGPDAQLDAYGNLPRDFVDDEMADGAVWVHLKPDEPPALVRQVNGRLEILALIVHELHYDKPRLPFYDIVTSAVVTAFPAAFEVALAVNLAR